MKIIIAENTGFCFGVERAYNMSLELLKEESCQMLGHLVHNEKVVEDLKNKGLRFVSDIEGVEEKGTVIIRAHGVGDKIMEALKSKGVKIIDATCPLVKRAQDFARLLDKNGKKVVIIGEKGHAEVEAINGSVGERAVIVEKEEDIINIPKDTSLGIVIQTTKDQKLAEEMTEKIRERFKDVEACNTLCHAVLKRQQEVSELADKVDVILVVGSKSSANTQTLVKVAQRSTKAYGVEGPEDLKDDWFNEIDSVGIISGTSTPAWLINAVKDKITLITS